MARAMGLVSPSKILSPGGTSQFCPWREPWVTNWRHSSENVFWIVVHTIFLEQGNKLLLEAPAFVVFGLPLNVTDHGIQLRIPDAECAVSGLPGKFAAVLAHPARRV